MRTSFTIATTTFAAIGSAQRIALVGDTGETPYYSDSLGLYDQYPAMPAYPSQYAKPPPVYYNQHEKVTQYDIPTGPLPIYEHPPTPHPSTLPPHRIDLSSYEHPSAPQPIYEHPSAPQPIYEHHSAPQPIYEHHSAPQPIYEHPSAPQPIYEHPSAPQPVYGRPGPSQYGYPDEHEYEEEVVVHPLPHQELPFHYPEPEVYAPAPEHQPQFYDNVPHGDLWNEVHNYDEWTETFTQTDYEARLDQEASIMVALEAIREALVHLDAEIDDLDDCIEENEDQIEYDQDGVLADNYGVDDNIESIKYQQKDVKYLQKRCKRCQETLDTNKDVLILYCQQFAFAQDMVGPCADLLTCAQTQLPYKADIFTGIYLFDRSQDVHPSPADYHIDEEYERPHEEYMQAPSNQPPLRPGHYNEQEAYGYY